MTSDFWNERYAQEEFIYGVHPNEYLKSKLNELQQGTALFVAEGEGRNAVYAATKKWNVFAFDQSLEGKKKAELLAVKHDVTIHYIIADVHQVDYPENNFDMLAMIYTHFPEKNRREYHQKLASFLKPGGKLILEGFSKSHIKNQQVNPMAGGPKDESMLYNLDELKKDFEGFEFHEAQMQETTLNEGKYHSGNASVIRIFATKKQ